MTQDKNLEVRISHEEFVEILGGRKKSVCVKLEPHNFFTCCYLLFNGRHFDTIEDAMAVPEYAEWLKDHEFEIMPAKFDTITLHTPESGDMAMADVVTAEIEYPDAGAADGVVFTKVNDIEYGPANLLLTLKNPRRR